MKKNHPRSSRARYREFVGLILLMEEGRNIERGTHDALRSAHGVYHGIVVRQMQSDSQLECLEILDEGQPVRIRADL
jgi:hypothetical protein